MKYSSVHNTSSLLESTNLLRKNRFRFYSGLVLGTGYAVLFYFLLYSTREVLRCFWISDYYDIWLLSDQEVQFYNLFYAYVSTILGQSICFTIWFERPKDIYERNYRRRLSIVNDHKVFNWFFLAWFSKLAIAYAALLGATYGSYDFYIFSFIPKYEYLFILIIIVLFLQTWPSFNLKYKLKGIKWMLVSSIVISIFSLGLSKVNLIDYNQFNSDILRRNVYEAYQVILPEAKYYKQQKHRDRLEQIYLVNPIYQESKEPFLIMDNEHCSLDEIPIKVLQVRDSKPQELINMVQFQLNIAPTVKMDYIESLKKNLANIGIPTVYYGVVPKNHPYDRKYYKNYLLSTSNSYFYFKYIKNLEGTFKINIEPIGSHKFILNGQELESKEIGDILKQLISNNSNYVIHLTISKSTSFKDYFTMLEIAQSTIVDLRNLEAENRYEIPFENLPKEARKVITKEYPMRIIEENKGPFPVLDSIPDIIDPPFNF